MSLHDFAYTTPHLVCVRALRVCACVRARVIVLAQLAIKEGKKRPSAFTLSLRKIRSGFLALASVVIVVLFLIGRERHAKRMRNTDRENNVCSVEI